MILPLFCRSNNQERSIYLKLSEISGSDDDISSDDDTSSDHDVSSDDDVFSEFYLLQGTLLLKFNCLISYFFQLLNTDLFFFL